MIYYNFISKLKISGLIFILFFFFAQTAFSSDAAKQLSDKVRTKINNYYYNTLYDKLNIFDIVSQIPGVKEITDNIVVNSSLLPDDVIEANIISEIKVAKSILEPDRIQVHVDNGEVILNGEVSLKSRCCLQNRQ